MIESIYSCFIESKTQSLIPQFHDGKTMESKYNPEREAESIVSQIPDKLRFFLITGAGSGILVETLLNKIPDSMIIIIENNDSDYNFLSQNPKFQALRYNQRIIFSTIDKIYNDLLNHYFPAFYGDLKIIERIPWLSHVDNKKLSENIKKALSDITADYSVQSHFGKIWQHNIISNINLHSMYQSNKINIDTTKTAVIIAAGPTIDSKINYLKENRNNFYIISTDTAFSILQKNNIRSDCVVSIDGQNLSYNHFLSVDNKYFSDTLFLLDLCSNPDASSYIRKNNGKLRFYISGHPLSSLLTNNYLSLYSGSGTVTISALDFAIKMGFKDIEVLGADFGFFNGKSYGKGCYFEELYSKNITKLFNSETKYDNLMFRTELQKINGKYTTNILNNYRISFENYLKNINLDYFYDNNIYSIKNIYNKSLNLEIKSTDFNIIEIEKLIKNSKEEELRLALLPYIAFLRLHNNTFTWEEYFNKAQADLLKLVKNEE